MKNSSERYNRNFAILHELITSYTRHLVNRGLTQESVSFDPKWGQEKVNLLLVPNWSEWKKISEKQTVMIMLQK